MNLNKIKTALAEDAKANNICSTWLNQLLKAPDFEALFEMYIKGIDFCFSNNFPSNNFIRKYFKGFMESKNIYLDETIYLENTREIVCLGDTRLNYISNQFTVTQIFIKDKCKANIVVQDNAFVMIDAFDEVELDIKSFGNSKVRVNAYLGAKITTEQLENSMIKIVNKNSKTYE